MEKRIFKLPAYPTSYFSGNILVNCPKCKGLGIVSTKLGKYIIPRPFNTSSNYVCCDCEFRNKIDGFLDNCLFQGVIDRKCSNCNKKIFTITEPTSNMYSFKSVTCTNCRNQNDYKLNWFRYKIDKPIDPYFNYELKLQLDIKGNTMWFYNLDHMQYLKKYISSELREDNGRHKYSMISNLPKFIIMAKHREMITKKINKLLSEIKEKQQHDT